MNWIGFLPLLHISAFQGLSHFMKWRFDSFRLESSQFTALIIFVLPTYNLGLQNSNYLLFCTPCTHARHFVISYWRKKKSTGFRARQKIKVQSSLMSAEVHILCRSFLLSIASKRFSSVPSALHFHRQASTPSSFNNAMALVINTMKCLVRPLWSCQDEDPNQSKVQSLKGSEHILWWSWWFLIRQEHCGPFTIAQ